MRVDESQKPQSVSGSIGCTNLGASLGGAQKDVLILEGMFGRRKYKLWAVSAVTLLAIWSMYTGSVTLKSSASDLQHSSQDMDAYGHGDLDVLDVDDREKMVRQLWNVYKHGSIAQLSSFWRDAFGAAYQELTSEIAGVRDAALLEIAKMSFWSVDIYESPPLQSISGSLQSVEGSSAKHQHGDNEKHRDTIEA